MTKQVQRRRGTATQHTSFTGAEGELSVNTTNKSVHVHDNVTAGGFEAARADMDNVTSSSILTAAGITATTAELNYVDGVTSSIQTQLDGKAGTASPTFTGTLTTANLTATGTTTLAGASTSADITFGDNDKAIFGAGSDLQIYHDAGGDSYIKESGSGNLYLEATNLRVKTANNETYIAANQDGAVTLYYNNSLKLATTSTGIDVTGTVTADGLTVDGDITLTAGDKLKFNDDRYFTPENNIDGAEVSANGVFRIKTGATPVARLLVGGTGDISFYEDTGTTAKFFWDASAESLGIGTSSPAYKLDVASAVIQFGDSTDAFAQYKSSAGNWHVGANSSNAFAFYSGTYGSGTERMRIDSNGNVMVGGTVAGNAGTVSLNVGNVGSTNGGLQLWGTTTGTHYIQFGDESGTAANHYRGYMAYAHNGDSLRFGTASAER
ncbi:MAG: hypothetical protein ACPHUD_10475, partial [Porticoccaceae bacterium]